MVLVVVIAAADDGVVDDDDDDYIINIKNKLEFCATFSISSLLFVIFFLFKHKSSHRSSLCNVKQAYLISRQMNDSFSLYTKQIFQ